MAIFEGALNYTELRNMTIPELSLLHKHGERINRMRKNK